MSIALMVDAYLPLWLDRVTSKAYGFNLFIEPNKTIAVLDAPLPQYLTQLQSQLRAGQAYSYDYSQYDRC